MNIIGSNVTHLKYGKGKIVGIYENKMKVDFSTSTKTFIYPEAFEKYFSISDKKTEEYINDELEKINRVKKIKREQIRKEEKIRTNLRNLKINVNSHAVFRIDENDLSKVLDTMEVSTGKYITGKNKGNPRVPQSLNINSACLLTTKADSSEESERIIKGIFMVPNDFVGSKCKTGMFTAHDKYRIVFESDEEKMYFWNYFPEEDRLKKWGTSEMKYIPNTIIKQILKDVINITTNEDKKEDVYEFYKYFCKMNNM